MSLTDQEELLLFSLFKFLFVAGMDWRPKPLHAGPEVGSSLYVFLISFFFSNPMKEAVHYCFTDKETKALTSYLPKLPQLKW